MLRIVLQRFAVQRSIAEQLEAVPLDEVLRRMQSSSLTNPARSLEAHFVLADQGTGAASPPSPCASFSPSPTLSSSKLLRNALSERLLAEVRHDLTSPHLSLDSGSLMLANCLRHQLSPLATQQIFALWLRFMQHGGSGGASVGTSSARVSLSMLGLGRSSERGTAQERQLLQFQSLVRVLEACLDAQTSLQVPAQATTTTTGQREASSFATSVCFSLDDWAGLVDTVEQYWPLFLDYGTSTTGLLVQFTALALELTARASSTPAAAEPGTRFAHSLRRLSHLQTDRGLLQTRIFSLCGEAVKSLCALEKAEEGEGNDDTDSRTSQRSRGPWWHHPQELVRLSQARRRLEAYESGQMSASATGSNNGMKSGSYVTGNANESTAEASHSSSQSSSATRTPAGGLVRGTRVGTQTRSAASSASTSNSNAGSFISSGASSRWMPRLPNTWWPGSAAASYGSAGTTSSARVGKQLGKYITLHALQHTGASANFARNTTANIYVRHDKRRRSSSSTSTASARPPASVAVALKDVLEIFTTVCATASTSGDVASITTFSWWVRDVIAHQHGRRSLHDVDEMTSLLQVGSLCLAFPDGTQTVLAEVHKCLQRSALFVWQAGDANSAFCLAGATHSALFSAVTLWPRACEIVAETLPLSTVRSEADRTLRALVSTVQQTAPQTGHRRESSKDAPPDQQLLLRHRRYGMLILACLLLQGPNGYVTPTLAAHIRELVVKVPFSHVTGGPNELASAARALFLFTHTERRPSRDKRSSAGDTQVDEVVFYLLNQLSQLLTASTNSLAGGPDSNATAELSRTLSSLTANERQLLRSALRKVRAMAAGEGNTSSMTARVALDETSSVRGRREDTAKLQAGLEHKTQAIHASKQNVGVRSPAGPDTFLNALAKDRNRPQGAKALPPPLNHQEHDATPPALRDGHVGGFDEQLLQREIEAVSQQFGKRHSTL